MSGKSVCLDPGCPKLIPKGTGYCDDHGGARQPWRPVTSRPGVKKRMTGRRLQRARLALFADEPWCRLCARVGKKVLATIRDHIVPLAEGGTDDRENIQPLCQACSDAKTQEESRRGMNRHP